MPGKTFITKDAALRVLKTALRPEDRDRILKEFGEWLDQQPDYPNLVGTTTAAKLLGIKTPHVSRLRDQGRMPDPVPVDGGNDVYIREEVEALARVLAKERRARESRRGAPA